MHHNYIEIFLVLVFIITIAKLAGVLSQRLGQPAVLGEIAAGLILGPTILAIAYWPIFPESHEQHLEHKAVKKAIEGIAENEDEIQEKVDLLGDYVGEDFYDYLRALEVVYRALSTKAQKEKLDTTVQMIISESEVDLVVQFGHSRWT